MVTAVMATLGFCPGSLFVASFHPVFAPDTFFPAPSLPVVAVKIGSRSGLELVIVALGFCLNAETC